ncbi:MAG TPA: hypothetical protein VFZ77_03145, partial [Acidimicrobiales bacterium]
MSQPTPPDEVPVPLGTGAPPADPPPPSLAGEATANETRGFQPPPYPYDRLDELREIAASWSGGAVDLSIGTPYDPPPAMVVTALGL